MTLYEDRACQVFKRVVKRRSRLTRLTWSDPLRGSCVSYDNAWYKTLVLETSAAPLGKKSRAKRALSLSLSVSLSLDLRGSLLKEVSYKTLVLETSAAHF